MIGVHVRTLMSMTLLPFAAMAQQASPAGLWKSVDDASGEPRALIRIVQTNGALQGRIERVIPGPTESANPVCEKCQGADKGAPVVGLTILSGFKLEGDAYTGGTILDPENGKTYRSTMQLQDNGRTLKVRGYIGVPAFGRTQTWTREE